MVNRGGPLLYFNITCEHLSSALLISLTGGCGKLNFEESETMPKIRGK